MLCTEHLIVRSTATTKQFGGNNNIRSLSVFKNLLESFTERNFSLSSAIDLSSIKEVDTKISCSFDTINGKLLNCFKIGIDPTTIADD